MSSPTEAPPDDCVVVGVDGSAEAEAAVGWALEVATALGNRLAVVHAVGLLEEGGFRDRPDIAGMVRRAVDCRAGAASTPVEILFEDGPAADVIARVAERTSARLVVVGRRGIGRAPRPLGSVSEGLLMRAHVPVLVVPAA